MLPPVLPPGAEHFLVKITKIIGNLAKPTFLANERQEKSYDFSKRWKTIGKTTFCHLVISSACSMGTPESLDSSGKPLENVGKTVHLHCASQVSGDGVPGFAKNSDGYSKTVEILVKSKLPRTGSSRIPTDPGFYYRSTSHHLRAHAMIPMQNHWKK